MEMGIDGTDGSLDFALLVVLTVGVRSVLSNWPVNSGPSNWPLCPTLFSLTPDYLRSYSLS